MFLSPNYRIERCARHDSDTTGKIDKNRDEERTLRMFLSPDKKVS
jgi:hypothetical protein